MEIGRTCRETLDNAREANEATELERRIMRIVVFDLETRKHTSELSDDREEAFQRLRSGDGGISAMCIYDMQNAWLDLYDDKPLSLRAGVSHLEGSDVVVGYCSSRFDLPCIEGIYGRRLRLRCHIDLYRLIAQTLAHRGIMGQRGDYTLDAVCRRCFGRGKSGSGASVSELEKAGRFGEIFNYCGRDVQLTRDLLLYVADHGGIQAATGSFLPIHLPDGIRRVLDAQM
jgi:DEAD/DEAH box helicase domain-containing protein